MVVLIRWSVNYIAYLIYRKLNQTYLFLSNLSRNKANVEGAAHKQVVNLIKLSDDTLM